MIFLEILNFFPMIFIDKMSIVALAPTLITIYGFTFQPLLVMLSISGS